MDKKIIVFGLFLSLLCPSVSQGQDKLLGLLKSELTQQFNELRGKEIVPYHMNFRVIDRTTSSIRTSFGNVISKNSFRQRTFVPQIRVGNELFDNFFNNDMGVLPTQEGFSYSILPIEDENSENAVRQAIWKESKSRYEFANSYFQSVKAGRSLKIDNEDKAPLFSFAPVEKYYEEPFSKEKLTIDFNLWENRLKEISGVFTNYKKIISGSSSLVYSVERRYFVNTDGTEVVQNLPYARLMVMGETKADDGMVLPLYLSYFAYDVVDLPSNEAIIKDVEKLAEKLNELRDAPVAEPYTGPAILSGAASGVFFHEIFGHRIEGQRMKSDRDGQTFKNKIGELVLPADLQVYDDPSLRSYDNLALNGYYRFDDQGVKAERVDVVIDGKMNDFLMTRTPLDNHPKSNGHARADGGADPVSRQSNLVIETKNKKTDKELRELLIQEVKKQNKTFGFFFKEVTGGFTFTGKGSINSFNVTPLEVYQIFADGKPDRLVRGVDMIGTPLSMFSNIIFAGGDMQIFTGMCGAESGSIPVTAISPAILVSKVEVQTRAKSMELPPLTERPEYRK